MSKTKASLCFTLLAVLMIAAGLILFPSYTASAARDALALCGSVLIPSLFPFFVLSGLVIESGLATRLGHVCEKLMRPFFRVCGVGSSALILGIIGGYPIGAACAIDLYEKRLCSKTEAERLLAFCNNSGPAFILGAIGGGVFHSVRIGILLYAVHIIASICVGILFRFYRYQDQPSHTTTRTVASKSFTSAFPLSVRNGLQSTLNVCAFVIFFAVLLQILKIFGIIPAFSAILGGGPLATQGVIGCFEVTTGLCALHPTSGTLSSHFILASFLLGFAGLAIHCQVLSFLNGSDLSLMPYFIGKTLHGVISAVLAFCIVQIPALFPQAVTCMSVPDHKTMASAYWLIAWFALFLTIPIKKHWKTRR